MPTDWSSQLSDLAVRRAVGPRAFLTGASYVQGNRVRELTVDPGGKLLFGSVQGTQRTPYRVVVTPTGSTPQWSGRCTCPVGTNCKHVAAVMIAARSSQVVVGRAAKPSWEGPLAALVRARTALPVRSEVPLALQLEVVAPVAPRYGQTQPGRAARQRVRIRPVMRGSSGKWVRTGISWRDLQHDFGRPAHERAHLEALRAVFATYLANNRNYYGYGYDATIHLDDLGPSLWRLLAQADEAGLQLVPTKASAGAVTVVGPAGISLDLRRATPSTSATLEPVVSIGGHTLGASSVEFLGDPLHGLFVTDPQSIEGMTGVVMGDGGPPPGMVLAPLDERPDEHVADLLRQGSGLEIPADDVPRFLQVYYPGLRQAVTVTSTDDTVKLPEVAPPRLAVTVTFRPDHEVSLDSAFAYRVADGVERVPLDAEDDGAVARDRRAEQLLLDGLDAPARHLLVPHLRLNGMDAVSFTQDLLPALKVRDDVLLTVVGEPPDYRHADMPPVIRLSATDTFDDPDWFDLGVAVSVDGEEIPFDQLFVALAGDQSHLVLDSGTYFSLERSEFEQLRRLIAEARAMQDRESDGLRVSVYQAGLWEELLELGVVETQSERWAGAVQGLLDVEDLAPPTLPTGFDADLRPYQLDFRTFRLVGLEPRPSPAARGVGAKTCFACG